MGDEELRTLSWSESPSNFPLSVVWLWAKQTISLFEFFSKLPPRYDCDRNR